MKEHIDAKIFDLLVQKPFDKLSDKERVMVQVYYTSEEYDEIRNTILSFVEEDEGLQLKLETNRSSHIIVPKRLWWNHSIPLYQVAAGLLILVTANLFYLNGMKSSEKAINTDKNNSVSIAEDQVSTEIIFNF